MGVGLGLTVTTDDPAAIEAVDAQAIAWLDEHSTRFGVVFRKEPFAITARIDGRLVGALSGSTNQSWVHISLLAVDPAHRHGGVGRVLLERAEALARQRGCIGAWLDTYDFQGPDYYPRFGYAEFGRIDDMPPGRTRFFFKKRF